MGSCAGETETMVWMRDGASSRPFRWAFRGCELFSRSSCHGIGLSLVGEVRFTNGDRLEAHGDRSKIHVAKGRSRFLDR